MSKQQFKSIYFKDYPSDDSKGKSVTLAFSEPETTYYSKVKELSNEEIRELIGIDSYNQLTIFAKEEDRSINQVIKRLIKNNINKCEKFNKNDITFASSKSIPFQRWYPYIEGYSPEFVKSLIVNYSLEKSNYIYDPFAGTGTTLFAADNLSIKTLYSEINPLLQFLINTKISILNLNEIERNKLATQLINISEKITFELNNFNPDPDLAQSYNVLFNKSKYFQKEVFDKVLRLRSYLDNIKLENELLSNTLSIAVIASLIPVSNLKKAGDVRFKNKQELKKKIALEDFLPIKIIQIAKDIANMDIKLTNIPEYIIANSKNIDLVNDISFDAIITSPPYLNGTNYFRNTKLELWFLRYIKYNNDLRYLRDQVLTSGINDVKKDSTKENQNFKLNSKLLDNTLDSLVKNAYDKRIPIMARNYFEEMYSIFLKLTSKLENNATILIDIGDSIFANVHIPTHDILVDLFEDINYKLIDKQILRKRRSRNKSVLSQTLLHFKYEKLNNVTISKNNSNHSYYGEKSWKSFKEELPHRQFPLSKRNWGHKNHSLCSYQGKLKPSIAYNLVKTFVPENGKILDPFSGVGTIPFEASLNGMKSYGMDISKPAYYISSAKVSCHKRNDCFKFINQLKNFILNNECHKYELEDTKKFGFNKKIIDYYETNTLKEILLSRRFILENPPKNSSEMMVVSSLLHILHGNRPYALSRRSHPIVPYAPKGEFIYKNLIESLKNKVNRVLSEELPINFKEGKIFNHDTTTVWPQEINDLDAIITSPPFFDSTRFHSANWIRLWFAGWSEGDFKEQINSFIEEKQKINFNVYENVFRQSRERLKKGGVCVLHLGKSHKCDMAKELQKISKKWFRTADLFDESVAHCESHGFRDKGTVTSHQYLVLT